MLKSMTAYGRATVAVPLGHFSVEISSVNRRHLEVNVSLPSGLLCFDTVIKKWVAAKISRGTVTVKLTAEFSEGAIVSAKPNLPLARQLKVAWEEMAADLALPPERGFKLEMLADVDQIIFYENHVEAEKELPEILHGLLNEALQQLVAMKEKEGDALQEDIFNRLETIRHAIRDIADLAPDAAKRYHKKLQERLQEAIPDSIENEERLMRELCLYAEKTDVSEELTRLKSHVHQFVEMMNDPSNGSIAKPLEFFLQEINREINTIASKASELKISQLAIVVKSELEKIREQIQNVE